VRVAAVMVMAVMAEAAGREVATWVAEAMAQAGMGGGGNNGGEFGETGGGGLDGRSRLVNSKWPSE
jgi:hypothetical protein